MESNANAINWFEIPVADFERGKKFYETIFDIKMIDFHFGDTKMTMFPMADGKVSGGICQGSDYTPSKDGAIIYLNGNPDLQIVLDRIPAAGGQVIQPKTQITPEIGFMALFLDSEGNRVALHSKK
jgi:uncharacterized protein